MAANSLQHFTRFPLPQLIGKLAEYTVPIRATAVSDAVSLGEGGEIHMTEDQTVFRRAGLLDIPSIYRLAQLGSFTGAYNDRYLSGKGHVLLLKQLLGVCLSLWLADAGIGGELSPLAVLEAGDEIIGFTWLDGVVSNGRLLVTVLMFSIAPEYSGKGHGQALLGNIIRKAPKGAIVRAECTRYADRMKLLLRRAGFSRQRQSIVRPGATAVDVYEKTVD
ncbi:GNAT family N-acetyltransferase [Ralstonia sp. SET104]|uniref:GNAT family N-acetyltransferase n=1 Tax=Ralstonia sp. SET104 TaxID=2448774 RepID=UPI0021A9877A|nr:GNAT family N-acetyltransferase [Ralstonia sp. SET104]